MLYILFLVSYYFQLLSFRTHRRNFDEKLRGEEKLGAEIFQQKTEIVDRDKQLSDAKATMDKYLRDYDALFARTQKVGFVYVRFWLCLALGFVVPYDTLSFSFRFRFICLAEGRGLHRTVRTVHDAADTLHLRLNPSNTHTYSQHTLKRSHIRTLTPSLSAPPLPLPLLCVQVTEDLEHQVIRNKEFHSEIIASEREVSDS